MWGAGQEIRKGGRRLRSEYLFLWFLFLGSAEAGSVLPQKFTAPLVANSPPWALLIPLGRGMAALLLLALGS